jgi:hypothetical protein
MAQPCDRQLVSPDGEALPAIRMAGLAITRQTSVRFIGIRVPREAIAHALLLAPGRQAVLLPAPRPTCSLGPTS